MNKSEFFEALLDKLMSMPDIPKDASVEIEMESKESEPMEHEDAEMDKEMIDEELKKKIALMGMAK